MKIRSFLRRTFSPGNLTFIALGALLVFLYLSTFGIVRVSGRSMDPTLADGQFLVGLQVQSLPFLEVSRGDIVTVNVAAAGKLYIKRVIAVPGDRVKLAGGQLYLNGELQYEPYLYEPMDNTPDNNIDEFTVPEGKYYILGDNRNISRDSRSIGCVDEQDLQTLIPLRYQVPLTAGMLIIIALLLRAADAFSTSVDLRWAAYLSVKKARNAESVAAEPEDTEEQPSPQEEHDSSADTE